MQDQTILIVINDAPYGTEKAYNALRMTMTLQGEHKNVKVKIFLLADGVGCAIPNQKTPNGYYNIERMLKSVIQNGAEVKACVSCLQARGADNIPIIPGLEISNMKEFTEWVTIATKIITF